MKYLAAATFTLLFLSFTAHGADLKCPPGQYRVKGHHRNGYVRHDGTTVKASTVKTYCKLLSREYEYLNPRFKNGLPKDWPHRKEISSPWTEADKQRMIESLEEVPDLLLTSKIEGFYRAQKSKDYPNPASSSDGIIVTYDSSFDAKRNLGRILAHELSHQHYLDLDEAERKDYRRATGWHIEVGNDRIFYWTGRKEGYVEEDGKYSPQEDYANNIEYYIYSPDKLKERSPQAYTWIDKKYGAKLKRKELK